MLTFVSGGYIFSNSARTNSKGGGGLYCRESSAVTMDSGYVTNNKAQNGVCEVAHFHLDGGGGIRLENASNLTLYGGYITGNMAGSGAGICVKGKSSNAMLTMNGGYICANRNEVSCGIAGHQKEGAGISIREVGAIVQITSGYINNNSIAQSEDWGGGGIFCTEGAYLYIEKILATNNHARGFGGGLAGCLTGHVFVLGGAAAVFDNRADGTQLAGAGSTKHADKDALTDTTFMTSGYSDFFCALGGQVQKSMLGGAVMCDGFMFVGDWSDQENITVGSTMDVTAK